MKWYNKKAGDFSPAGLSDFREKVIKFLSLVFFPNAIGMVNSIFVKVNHVSFLFEVWFYKLLLGNILAFYQIIAYRTMFPIIICRCKIPSHIFISPPFNVLVRLFTSILIISRLSLKNVYARFEAIFEYKKVVKNLVKAVFWTYGWTEKNLALNCSVNPAFFMLKLNYNK